MSLRIAPPVGHASSTQPVSSAPSAPGLPDTLRNNTLTLASGSSLSNPSGSSATKSSSISSSENTLSASLSQPHLHAPPQASSHPLESRLAGWRSTAYALKMAGLRRNFGLAEPVRRGMELEITRGGEWRPLALGGSEGVSGDVLEGRDWSVEWEDVYDGGKRDGLVELGREEGGILAEMEGKVKMGAL